MLRFGNPPYLECSGKGDRRFSAFWARIRSRGGRTIEELYQAAKVFEDGTTGLSWRQAKGRKPINVEQVRAFYSQLWNEYTSENLHLVAELCRASGLSDIYGQSGHACQAEELWRIRSEALAYGWRY